MEGAQVGQSRRCFCTRSGDAGSEGTRHPAKGGDQHDAADGADATAAIDPTTGTKHLSTPVFTVGSGIAAGTVLYAGPVPMEGNAYERFLGVLQTTGVAAVTAGKVNAFLTHDVAKWKAYSDGI